MEAKSFNAELVCLEPALKRYAYSLTLNMEDAKDLVQETLYKALVNEDKFDAQTNIKAWLYTILRNTFINDYRRKNKSEKIFSNDVKDFVLKSKLADSSPESDVNFKELTFIVNTLEPEFRIPFQMHDDGFKYQEIAEELGLQLGTVKSRIHFSRKKLIDMIGSK